MLQNFIQQQIQSAVQAAVQEAMQKFQLNLQPPVKDERANQEAPPPKRRRKGKGQGNPSGEPPRADKVQEPVGAKNKGKGKANAKPDEPKTQQQGGRGRGQISSQKEADGKGVGAKASPPPQSSADNKDGWTQVKRQRDHTKEAPFALRQQDWNAPLVSFSGLAKRLQETKSDEVCRGVILCPRKEIETARALLAGTTKKYALLLIVLAKEYPEKPKDLKTQQVPGQIGNILRAQDAYIQQAVSTGQSAPQPVGISSTPQKVATKATAVLFVKVPRAFTEGSLWKNFVEKPQRQIAQWTAARHVLCIDCFQWAEEQLQGGRRQVHGVIRVAQADVSTLLAHSGEQGIFVQLPRGKVVGQHVEWAERITKGESDAEYLTRVNRARGDLGLVCRDLSLGWRRPNDPTTPVHKVWILERAPKTWDLQQVAGLLKEQFSDINMFRQVHRGNWKNFIFRAACKRGCDADLVPVTVILDELGASNAPVTLWAKIAPPRHIEYKQRHIKGGSIPFFDKPSLFDPVTVPGPSNAKSDKEDEAEKENPTPDPKRTCSAKRPVPAGTILQKQPADGDCLFHSFSAGLFHLRKDKESEPIHPHELRARTVAHIRRYTERYKPQWEADGKLGPDGTAVDTWENFLEAIAKTGAYAGDAELKALCRIFDIRVVLVPEAPQFPVCVFHRRAAAKRTVAIYHTHHHFDYLAPADKGYPDEITQVSADPSGGFLVGGTHSFCSAFTKSSRTGSVKTTWTSQIGKSNKSKASVSRSGPKNAPRPPDSALENGPGSSLPPPRLSRNPKESGSCNSLSKTQPVACKSIAGTVWTDPESEEEPRASGLDLGISPLVSPFPVPSSRSPKDRGPQVLKRKTSASASRAPAGSDPKSPLADARRAANIPDDDSQDLEGCEPTPRKLAKCSHRQPIARPEDGIFRCEICPFQQHTKSRVHFKGVYHMRYQKCHHGAHLPGPLLRPRVQKLTGGARNAHWTCPLCKMGVSKETRSVISRHVFSAMREDHRCTHHPEIAKAEWTRLISLPQTGPKDLKAFGKDCRQRALQKVAIKEVSQPRFPGMKPFIWPIPKHAKSEQTGKGGKRQAGKILRISLQHAWLCKKCGVATKDLPAVRKHSQGSCPPPTRAKAVLQARLKQFSTMRTWVQDNLPPAEQTIYLEALNGATQAVQQSSVTAAKQ